MPRLGFVKFYHLPEFDLDGSPTRLDSFSSKNSAMAWSVASTSFSCCNASNVLTDDGWLRLGLNSLKISLPSSYFLKITIILGSAAI